MYNEIELIKKITCKKTKAMIILLFIEEYCGWLQHLNSVGLRWGADGEEVGASNEAAKTKDHLKTLNSELLKLVS